MLDVSFIILSFNHFVQLDIALQSILSQTKDITFEVIVVDNASTEGDVFNVIPAHFAIHVVKNEFNIGWPSAINIGVSHAIGRYICIVDNDVIINCNTATVLLHAIESAGGNVIVAPMLLNSDGTRQNSICDYPGIVNQIGVMLFLNVLFSKCSWTNPEHMNYCIDRDPMSVEMVMGACIMFPAKIIKRTGLFGQEYFLHYGDTDFCLRFRRTGGRVLFIPTEKVIHLGSLATRNIKYSGFDLSARDMETFYRNYFSSHKVFVLLLIAFCSSLSRSIVWFFIGLVTMNFERIKKAYYLIIKGLIILSLAVNKKKA